MATFCLDEAAFVGFAGRILSVPLGSFWPILLRALVFSGSSTRYALSRTVDVIDSGGWVVY